MSWIELHQSVFHHRKTVDAAAELRVSNYLLVGHLAQLWCWAIDAAPPDGGPLSPHSVVEGARWPKKNGAQFVDVLLRYGFLDEDGGGLYVHDWEQYAGKLQARRARNAERMRSARATHVQDTSQARVEHVHPLPDRTVPNSTEPDPLSVPPTPHRTGLTAEEERVRIRLHALARDQLLGGRDAPDIAWCVDLVQRGATETDAEFAVQASLGKGLKYARAVLERRVEERENGVDHDQLARDRAAVAARESHGGASRARGVARNGAGAGSFDEFGDSPPHTIRATADGGDAADDSGATAPIRIADRARQGGSAR